jgi:porphobilinogen synthase
MSFPASRLRRLRQSGPLRAMVRETALSPGNLILPYFVVPGTRVQQAITSLPGQFQWSVDRVLTEVPVLKRLGIPAVLLFGIPRRKDTHGSQAYHTDGPVQDAVRQLKDRDPNLVIITDVCLCGYMSHGHCGVLTSSAKLQVQRTRKRSQEPRIDNDATLELLGQMAVSHAEAGADLVAPSDMMDGRVRAIRQALDTKGFDGTGIMSYAAKYASAFYGPFRDAAGSAPQRGDRAAYQMDAHNAREAVREVGLDLEEGADIVMVKPAMPYLDVIAKIRQQFPVPVAAYQVSGEYAMLKATAARGWIDEQRAMLESLTAIKRAGADMIVTYFAQAAAKALRKTRRRRR